MSVIEAVVTSLVHGTWSTTLIGLTYAIEPPLAPFA